MVLCSSVGAVLCSSVGAVLCSTVHLYIGLLWRPTWDVSDWVVVGGEATQIHIHRYMHMHTHTCMHSHTHVHTPSFEVEVCLVCVWLIIYNCAPQHVTGLSAVSAAQPAALWERVLVWLACVCVCMCWVLCVTVQLNVQVGLHVNKA